MRIHFTALFLSFGLFFSRNAAAQSTNDTLPALQARLKTLVDQPRFAQAMLGVKVISLATGASLFEHDANKLLKPASNAKMYTASLALTRLGPDYHIKTSFYASAKPDANGVVHGDLLVYGRGDPSFSWRFNDDDYSKALTPVINSLTAAGIKSIEGNLIGDDSYFRGPHFGSEWTWDDLETYYGAPASALTVQDNAIDLVFKPGKAMGDPCVIVTKPDTTILNFINRTKTGAAGSRTGIELYRPVGETNVYVWGDIALDSKGADDSVSVPDPALWFVSLLKTELAQHGIAVSGGVRSIDWLKREVEPFDPSKLVEVASVESPTLASLVKHTLKPSQNQYAQLLLLQVGAAKETEEDHSLYTQSIGMREMRKFYGEAGIKRGMASLEEGSGLSRGALVTPSASVQLLAFMSHQPTHEVFYDALPIGGVDGTLRNRFKKTAGANNVHAKTGSLGHVHTLSGYVTTRAGDKLAFSVMLNNYLGGDGIPQIDALVKQLADFNTKLP